MALDIEKLAGTAFDADQREVLVNVYKQAKEDAKAEAEVELKARLNEQGINDADDFFGMTQVDRNRLQQDAKANKLREIWDHNGVAPKSGRPYSWKEVCDFDLKQRSEYFAAQKAAGMEDTQFSTDQPLLIPRVATEYVREAVEPILSLTPLLTRVNYSAGTHIVFPATSAMGPAADIPEGGEYPKRRLEWAGTVTATIGKSGIAAQFTEEMIRYSQWDIMGMTLRAAGAALARWKEAKVSAMLLATATTDFNNDGGTPTSGRDAAGAANGTFTLDDLLVMYAAAINTGWTPDLLLMHPMAWMIFMRDPTMRNYVFQNGGNLWTPFQGQPGAAEQWKGGGFINDPRHVTDPTQIQTTYTPVPVQFPFAPLRIVVSPFIGYDSTNSLTDIYLLDSRDCGYMIVDEEVMNDEWEDKAHDIRYVKFRERYAVAAPFDTRVRLAENIVIAKSYDFDDRLTWDVQAGALTANTFDLNL